MELLETVLHSFVNFAMLLFEYIGVIVITFSGIQGFVNYLRKSPDTRLILAKGLAMGLEFKLGSEILRTVVVRNLSEIYIVAGIILLRAVLTFLIHWEIKNEESEELPHHEKEDAAEPASPNENAVPAGTASPQTANISATTEATASDNAGTADSAAITAQAMISDKPAATTQAEASDNAAVADHAAAAAQAETPAHAATATQPDKPPAQQK